MVTDYLLSPEFSPDDSDGSEGLDSAGGVFFCDSCCDSRCGSRSVVGSVVVEIGGVAGVAGFGAIEGVVGVGVVGGGVVGFSCGRITMG